MIGLTPIDLLRDPALYSLVGLWAHGRLRRAAREGREWPEADFAKWYDWHVRSGLAVAAMTGKCEILGFAAWRPVSDVAMAQRSAYEWDDSGPMIWLDAVASAGPRVFSALWEAGRRLLGREFERVAFKQARRGHRIREHAFSAMHHALRHGGRPAATA